MIKESSRTGTHRLTNYMEELASNKLEEILSKAEFKKETFTEGSIQDIKALALNRLWPMYITTASGKDFTRKVVVEDQVEKDVIRELRAAIEIVLAHPRK